MTGRLDELLRITRGRYADPELLLEIAGRALKIALHPSQRDDRRPVITGSDEFEVVLDRSFTAFRNANLRSSISKLDRELLNWVGDSARIDVETRSKILRRTLEPYIQMLEMRRKKTGDAFDRAASAVGRFGKLVEKRFLGRI